MVGIVLAIILYKYRNGMKNTTLTSGNVFINQGKFS